MRKAAVLFAFIIILISSFAVDAVEGAVVTENVSVRSGRLFEVKVAVSGDGVIASGTFELKFDSDTVEYRRVASDIDSALVRAKHEKGRTTVVFLRGGGVRTEKTPVLFRVTYKLVGSSDTAVEIKAGDCVDQKTKPIEVKNKAVCKVSAVGSGYRFFLFHFLLGFVRRAEQLTVAVFFVHFDKRANRNMFPRQSPIQIL